MLPDPDDIAIRGAAFAEIELLAARSPDGILSWEEIARGFELGGERLLFANRARGIFWPSRLRVGALSIKTNVPRGGRTARYDDEELASEAPYFAYRYQGSDPSSTDNRRLRQCLELDLPLIYFYGVTAGRYRPVLVHLVGDDAARLTFHVAPIDEHTLERNAVLQVLPNLVIERRYALATVRRRLHQDRFREAVLDAYAERCAICSLRHPPLLDAAHIVPDRERLGEARVPNGIAMCKLHHAAFDADYLGISPDLKVKLAPTLLDERDGPMLEHGLRGFQDAGLHVPAVASLRPDPALLALRFERFLGRPA